MHANLYNGCSKEIFDHRTVASSIVFNILYTVDEHVECVFKKYKRILILDIVKR